MTSQPEIHVHLYTREAVLIHAKEGKTYWYRDSAITECIASSTGTFPEVYITLAYSVNFRELIRCCSQATSATHYMFVVVSLKVA